MQLILILFIKKNDLTGKYCYEMWICNLKKEISFVSY